MHFGHYISGSAHAGVLSWLLVGSWFAPPEPAPLESVIVAMISSAEFAAMTMSDESPDAAQFTNEVVAPSEQEELDLQMPSQMHSLDQAVEIDMVSIAEVQETQLQKPSPLRVPSPRFEANMPSLNTPSENEFALFQSPKVIDAPQTANRISTLAIAPPPPDLKVDDLSLEAALPLGIEAPSLAEQKFKLEDVPSTAQPETAVQITPEISKEKPAAPAISLRPQSTTESLKNIEPIEEVAETLDDALQTSAPQMSLRPKARPRPRKAVPVEKTERVETPVDQSEKVGSPDSNEIAEGLTSSLTEQQEDEIRTTVKNAIRKNWIFLPGSPASYVFLVVRLEFDKNGTVKEGSIELITSKGGDDRASRTAFRAAKNAIKKASYQGAFKLPAEIFDGWKEVILEFDPEEMRNK